MYCRLSGSNPLSNKKRPASWGVRGERFVRKRRATLDPRSGAERMGADGSEIKLATFGGLEWKRRK